MSGDCVRCGHSRGAHHAGADGDNACAVKGCQCHGYAEPPAVEVAQ